MRLISSVGLSLAVSVATFLAAGAAPAQVASGTLRCAVKGGFGIVIAGDRAVTCVYRRQGQPTEFYNGHTGNLGIDIGPTNAQTVTYSVTADPLATGALRGDFFGPGVGVTFSTGFSANGLVGPGGAALMPIGDDRITASTGLNARAGISSLHLAFVGVETDGRRHRIEVLREYGIVDETR